RQCFRRVHRIHDPPAPQLPDSRRGSIMSVSILVVDDEPDVGELFRQRFRRETRQGKYVLHYATSGAEALDRLAGEIEPTLVAVLSDINMPGMDGIDLAKSPEHGSLVSGGTESSLTRPWREPDSNLYGAFPV